MTALLPPAHYISVPDTLIDNYYKTSEQLEITQQIGELIILESPDSSYHLPQLKLNNYS